MPELSIDEVKPHIINYLMRIQLVTPSADCIAYHLCANLSNTHYNHRTWICITDRLALLHCLSPNEDSIKNMDFIYRQAVLFCNYYQIKFNI